MGSSYKITVKTSSSTDAFEVEIDSTDPIQSVKEKVAKAKGDVSHENMKLICVGKILANDKKVSDYEGLKPKDDKQPFVVMIAPKKAGGAEPVASTTTSAPAAAAVEQASANTVSGESEQTAIIEQLTGMGFPHDQVILALRAAYNNPDRATEYLLNGIPEQISQEEAQATIAEEAATTRRENSGEPAPDANDPLAVLRTHPQFNQLRQMVQQNPAQLPAVLQVIGQSDPNMFQLITQHQQAFVNMLQEQTPTQPVSDDTPAQIAQAGGAPAPEAGSHVVRLSEEESAAVERLQALGFDRQSAVEAYIACDKNEEMAANFLFDNMAD